MVPADWIRWSSFSSLGASWARERRRECAASSDRRAATFAEDDELLDQPMRVGSPASAPSLRRPWEYEDEFRSGRSRSSGWRLLTLDFDDRMDDEKRLRARFRQRLLVSSGRPSIATWAAS